MRLSVKRFERVNELIEKLIVEENVSGFLFVGTSDSEYIFLSVITKLKTKYPHIQRIRTSIGVPFFGDYFVYQFEEYFDDTYYPGRIISTYPDRKVYRGNGEREGLCDFCIVYDEEIDDMRIEIL